MRDMKKMAGALTITLALAAGLLAAPCGTALAQGDFAPQAGQTNESAERVPGAGMKTGSDGRIRIEAWDTYYVTKGPVIEKAEKLLLGLLQSKTGLEAGKQYIYRMDKILTGNYFYHVKVFTPENGDLVVVGDFLLAKDDSCAWRRYPGKKRTELIAGTADKLLERVEIYPAYSKIPAYGAGKVIIRMPGDVPYQMKLTSLNDSVATVNSEMNQVIGVSRGKVDVLVEVRVAGLVKAKKVRFRVIDDKDENDRGWQKPFPIGIGIGIGIGNNRGGWIDVNI